MGHKKCNRCGELKPLAAYHKNVRQSDGYHGACRGCRKQETSKRYRENKRRIDEYNARYSKAHRIRKLVISERYRCKEIGASGDVSYADWKGVLEQQDYRCANCNEPKWLEMDHILALSLGGSHRVSNVQALCKRCNSRKSVEENRQLRASNIERCG